jgi:hypothetical protein
MAAPMTDAEKLRELIWCARVFRDAGSDVLKIRNFWPLVEAAEAHLSTLPKVKTVERWAVTYWSLTDRTTVCRMCVDEDHANILVASNGSTARKHQLSTLEHQEAPEA